MTPQRLSSLLLVFAVLLSGCKESFDQGVTQLPSYISFGSSVDGDDILRATGAAFDIDDRIGIFGYDAGTETTAADIRNREFVTGGNGYFSPVGRRIEYPEGDRKFDFFAYYPYREFTGLDVPLDLTKQEDFMYSDNLRNVAKATPAENTLVFKRQLSKVILHISPTQEGATIPYASAVFKGIVSAASFNIKSGALSLDKTKTADIEARVTSVENGVDVTIILFPTSESGTKADIMVGGKVYEWILDRELRAGISYRFNLKIEGGQIITTQRSEYEEVPVYTAGGAAPNSIKVLHFMNKKWMVRADNFGPRNFMVLYDKVLRVPYWVAHPLHPTHMGKQDRTNAWQYDPAIDPELQPNLKRSYEAAEGVGELDRGHLMPSGDRTKSYTENAMTFYFTNMAPQSGTFNRQSWRLLEEAVRSWVQSYGDTVYIVTGVTFEKETKTYTLDKDRKRSAVPDYFYKALMKKPKNGAPACIAFKIKNTPSTGNLYLKSTVTIEELERVTGFTLFPSVSDPEAKRRKDLDAWLRVKAN